VLRMLRDLSAMTVKNVLSFMQAEFDSVRRVFAIPLVRRSVIALVVVAFIAGIYISVNASPELIQDISWRYVLLLIAAGAPLLTLANSLDIFVMAKSVKSEIKFTDCIRVSVLSTATNLLPAPGGSIVRIAALSTNGASIADASWVTIMSGAVWFAIAFAAAGLAMSIYDMTAAAAFVAIAAAVAAGALFLAARAGVATMQVLTIASVKVIIVAIESMRYYWALKALNIDPNAFQAVVLSVATVVGSAIAVAPAGLGVREGVAALLAVAVTLDPAAGFLSSSINRITMYVMMAMLVTGFYVFGNKAGASRIKQ